MTSITGLNEESTSAPEALIKIVKVAAPFLKKSKITRASKWFPYCVRGIVHVIENRQNGTKLAEDIANHPKVRKSSQKKTKSSKFRVDLQTFKGFVNFVPLRSLFTSGCSNNQQCHDVANMRQQSQLFLVRSNQKVWCTATNSGLKNTPTNFSNRHCVG